MSERSAKHSTFVIERNYKHSPARVFAAWAGQAAKASWFPKADEFDFRVGGREFNRGGPPGGPSLHIRCLLSRDCYGQAYCLLVHAGHGRQADVRVRDNSGIRDLGRRYTLDLYGAGSFSGWSRYARTA